MSNHSGQFKIDGASLNFVDPFVAYNAFEELGIQGNTIIYNEYESATLSWTALTIANLNILWQRITAITGQRVQITIPNRGGSGWRSVYAFVHFPTYTHQDTLAKGVTIRITHITNTA